ncbi:MAG: lasso peptide biosynthesis B2 protein [Bacteroidales bacterium]|nr:lasso peptide biosynthesis B2 protein [Bacteroidales bacterium]
MSLIKVFYYIKRFFEIPALEKMLFFWGFLLLFIVTFFVKFLPFKYYLSIIRSHPHYLISNDKKPNIIKKTKKTLNRLEIIMPFNCSCFVKSIVYKLLLNFQGVQSNIVLGLYRKNSLIIEAHCYVKAENKIVFLKKKIDEIYTIN